MIFPVEIKVNVGARVDDALDALGSLPTKKEVRQIYFADDSDAVAHGQLPLLAAGVIVRIRTGDDDDATAKLRPCDPAQLHGRWTAPFDQPKVEYHIEGDWSDQRHVLAASVAVDHPPGSLLAYTGAEVDAHAALTEQQQRFLIECVPPGVTVNHLCALGPVTSTKWADVHLGGHKVNIERWRVLDLDFLEVSLRVKPKDGDTATEFETRAAAAQRDLHAGITSRGLALVAGDENKTQRVLRALLAAVHH